MKIYIAGKISGDPNYKNKFSVAADAVSAAYEGAVILNPADHPEGLSAAEYMRLCFAEIDMADMVMFLPDYKGSSGAQLELAYCRYTGKPHSFLSKEVTYERQWID